MKTILWLDDIKNPFVKGMDWWFTIQYLKYEYLEIEDEEDEQCEVIWVKTQSEFENYIKENGLPDGICFDHDLGKLTEVEMRKLGYSKEEARKRKNMELTGYDCAKWLAEYCMNNNVQLPQWYVHSSNSDASEKINELLSNCMLDKCITNI